MNDRVACCSCWTPLLPEALSRLVAGLTAALTVGSFSLSFFLVAGPRWMRRRL